MKLVDNIENLAGLVLILETLAIKAGSIHSMEQSWLRSFNCSTVIDFVKFSEDSPNPKKFRFSEFAKIRVFFPGLWARFTVQVYP